MGVALTELLVKHDISIEELKGKTLAVDAPQWLYQFMSSIRQRDGALLMDSKGNVTSHLMGLLSRITNISSQHIKLIFVFDGQPPELKKKVLSERRRIKEEAEKKYQEALKVENEENMRKYASMTSRLTKEMIGEAKELIRAFGIPVVEAPSEAEGQAAHMARKGEVFAIATTDADALLFGSPQIIRNLNMAGKRKKTNRLAYEVVVPDIMKLDENLSHLGISQDQLIALAMLVGTDYNPRGIKGIGPKNALKLVKQHGEGFNKLFEGVKWGDSFDYRWEEVFDLIKNTKKTDEYSLEWGGIDQEEMFKILVDRHEFSVERVNSYIKTIQEEQKKKAQRGLGDFF
jgi:flap endonuclease-1